jgi:hypothetical protein
MTIFEMLDDLAKANKLAFIVIGGHAVNAHGYSRFTKDLDILVERETRPAWQSALAQSGFGLVRDSAVFLQFAARTGDKWPLDLMLVNGATFGKLSADACDHRIGDRTFRIPSLDGLLALKFHVLKQEVRERGYKDLLDVLELARCNGIDVRSERMKILCEKFGSPKVYERIIAFDT